MASRLQDKVALITGGNSGIGLASAELFHKHGARVIITASSKTSFDKARKALPAHFDIVQCNVANLTELDSLFAHIQKVYGGLDVLFANAGVAAFKPTTDVDEAFYDSIMGPNVKGLYFTVQKALPLLRDGSSVVLNASVVAELGLPGASVYSATKAAVRNFARTWTAEIPSTKARFNVVSPGYTSTPIFDRMGMTKEMIGGFVEENSTKIPAKRFATPEEIANVALFLASSESSYVMGADIVVDGGVGQV